MSQPAPGRREAVALALTALFVELIYVIVISAGTFDHWPFYQSFVNDLAEGFRQGHLHLAVEPPAALLARPNPFAPENRNLWYWDASLYHGHYYLYWGPVPALLLAATKTLFRIHSVVGDDIVVFALATVQLGASAWIVFRAARTQFALTPLGSAERSRRGRSKEPSQGSLPIDRPPLWLQVLTLAVAGLANPTPYNLARPAVYESAIVGAHAFLLLGIAFVFEANARKAAGRWLVAAGAAWALAFGCRVSVAPAIAVLVLLTMLRWSNGSGLARLRRGLAPLAAVAVPLGLGVAALLLYNQLRFGQWLEFGRRFQLTWIEAPVAARFIPANLYSFLLRPGALSCRFPYLFALVDMGARAFPPWLHPPEGYFVYEPVVGLLLALPWGWAAPLAWGGVVADWRRERRLTTRAWAVLAVTAAGTLTLLAGLMVASATNRYLGDAAGGLALTGGFGLWIVQAALRHDPARQRAAAAGTVALAALSIAAGLALGFFGQYGQFPVNNPRLADKLVHALSVCGPNIPPPPN